MDAGTIQAAFIGAKAAIDALRTILGTRTSIEADTRVADALEQLGKFQDALFDMRAALADLQNENHVLKDRLREQDTWDARASAFKLVKAPGGGIVWHNAGPPEHYACPVCFENRRVQMLQLLGEYSGVHICQNCKSEFDVDKPKPRPSMYAKF